MSLSTAVMACRAALVAGAASLLAGCADYPRDPEDTTEKARSGTARVGITEKPALDDHSGQTLRPGARARNGVREDARLGSSMGKRQ
ncbi:hypothetical protein QW131_30220 [Roseibium salinum]|nr:hypothetical protein [Roseibium salinum]